MDDCGHRAVNGGSSHCPASGGCDQGPGHRRRIGGQQEYGLASVAKGQGGWLHREGGRLTVRLVSEVACCAPMEMQHATMPGYRATAGATTRATDYCTPEGQQSSLAATSRATSRQQPRNFRRSVGRKKLRSSI